MATILIRNLDERTKDRLRMRAARHKRSMEDEARNILRTALNDDSQRHPPLAQAIADRFRPLGGIELELPEREPIREPPQPRR
jgi:antitoxin FitA